MWRACVLAYHLLCQINEDPKDAMLRALKEEIEMLRKMLDQHQSGASLQVSSLIRAHTRTHTYTDANMHTINHTYTHSHIH